MADQEPITVQVQPGPPFWQPALLVRPPYDELAETETAGQLWDLLALLAADPQRVRHGAPLQEASGLLAQYSGFIRQAKSYWDAAASVQDAAAALLYYYCFLNLAKAELLPLKPAEIEADPQHGLSVRTSQQDDVTKAHVKVELTGPRRPAPQMFAMLYEQRTGQAWPSDVAEIAVRAALRRVPEIGFEVTELGLDPVVCYAYHTVIFDTAFSGRSCLLLLDSKHVMEDPHVAPKLQAMYEEVPQFSGWRATFALSPRVAPAAAIRLQSRETHNIRNPSNPDKLRGDLGIPYWLDRIWSELDGIVEAHTNTKFDGLLLPSLSPDKLLPLPTGLSRYIGFFYTSALVRYRPSALDPVSRPLPAWLLRSFTRQAALPLLQDCYNHMAVKPVVFQGPRL